MWNAFAWHPHKPGNLLSNRAPTGTELQNGWNVLRGVLNLFAHARIVAIGNVAEATLKRLDVPVSAKVRHPSMGGANLFREQMADLCRKVA
jgi:hypothetical protein